VNIEYDPHFVEEVVFLEARRRDAAGEEGAVKRYHERLDPIYESRSGREQREEAFRSEHASFFREFGLDRRAASAVRESPHVIKGISGILITTARSKKDVGSELFQRDGAEGEKIKTAVVKTRVEDFLDGSRWDDFFLRELYRLSDMVDPAFGYRPSLGEGLSDPARESLYRDRYHVLWELWIDGRLCGKRGGLQGSALPRLAADMRRAFRSMGETRVERLCRQVWEAPILSHEDFVRTIREDSVDGSTGADGGHDESGIEEITTGRLL
jgi:hypothetical protein